MNKIIYLFLITIIIFIPKTTHAAWYWLVNPISPEQGDFVQLSALKYAETAVPKENLIFVNDDLKSLLDKAIDSKSCGSKYDGIIDTLQKASSSTEISLMTQNSLESCLENETIQLRLESALEDCDMDYLDTLTSGQKMINNEAINACRASSAAVNDVQQVTTIPVPVSMPTSLPKIETKTPIIPTVSKKLDSSIPNTKVEESIESSGTVGTSTEQQRNGETTATPTLSQQTNQKSLSAKDSFLGKIISFFSKLKFW